MSEKGRDREREAGKGVSEKGIDREEGKGKGLSEKGRDGEEEEEGEAWQGVQRTVQPCSMTTPPVTMGLKHEPGARERRPGNLSGRMRGERGGWGVRGGKRGGRNSMNKTRENIQISK